MTNTSWDVCDEAGIEQAEVSTAQPIQYWALFFLHVSTYETKIQVVVKPFANYLDAKRIIEKLY